MADLWAQGRALLGPNFTVVMKLVMSPTHPWEILNPAISEWNCRQQEDIITKKLANRVFPILH